MEFPGSRLRSSFREYRTQNGASKRSEAHAVKDELSMIEAAAVSAEPLAIVEAWISLE